MCDTCTRAGIDINLYLKTSDLFDSFDCFDRFDQLHFIVDIDKFFKNLFTKFSKRLNFRNAFLKRLSWLNLVAKNNTV